MRCGEWKCLVRKRCYPYGCLVRFWWIQPEFRIYCKMHYRKTRRCRLALLFYANSWPMFNFLFDTWDKFSNGSYLPQQHFVGVLFGGYGCKIFKKIIKFIVIHCNNKHLHSSVNTLQTSQSITFFAVSQIFVLNIQFNLFRLSPARPDPADYHANICRS